MARLAKTTARSEHESFSTESQFDFARVEEKWRRRWQEQRLYEVDLRTASRPYYNLMMFPYPSAEGLHIGNMYAYIGSDVHGRFQSMRGFDVFEPMGFDAFGIHSENFAIKMGVHPRALTRKNTARFKGQLESIGNRFDWSHEIHTTDPSYYRWSQWIFVQLFRAGLVERKSAAVNWCPKDKTVLADEQVVGGRCERCGTVVLKRELEQWFFKITAYADKLQENLDWLDWSERVKALQRHWIGRTTGLEFEIEVGAGELQEPQRLKLFTTRPDTIYGATFVALAPGHPLLEQIVSDDRREIVQAYVDEVSASVARPEETEREITGVFTGASARHPLTGEPLPVWVANYVLLEHGTGAIMGVPAHDARDFIFAEKMKSPVRQVVVPQSAAAVAESGGEVPIPSMPYTDPGILVDSGEWSGMTSLAATRAIEAWFESAGTGRPSVTYHLRDWLISRQRYWGPPIPIIYCPDHGTVPVPEDQLPVLLPEVENYQPDGSGVSPLAAVEEFVWTTCPICGKVARRETDVSDNFLDSGWYFLRYPSSDDDTVPWDSEMTRKWLPVDMYIGGAEHSVLHLLYSRFLTMALHDLGHLDFAEPFTRFRANGTITREGGKMSKSKGNIVSPDTYIERVGADAFRTYLLFMGPYEGGGDFSDRGLGGVTRFLDRVWQFMSLEMVPGKPGDPTGEARRLLHQTIQRVTSDISELKYNTAIAALMKYFNSWHDRGEITHAELRTFIQLLAPFAPYISEELWERLGEDASVHASSWPEVDVAALATPEMQIVIEVNGRVRGRIDVPSGLPQSEIEALALASDSVRRAIGERAVSRVIYVPGRLLSLVAPG